jgi:hypothetical protein
VEKLAHRGFDDLDVLFGGAATDADAAKEMTVDMPRQAAAKKTRSGARSHKIGTLKFW